MQDVSAFGRTVDGSAMFYKPIDANMADVAQGFVPNLQEKPAKKGWITNYDLAVVIGPGFTPEQPGGSTGAPPPSC
jgi:hypothetical protein